MPPIFPDSTTIAEDKMGCVPARWTVRVFEAILDTFDLLHGNSHLPSKAFHQPRTFHVTAKKTKGKDNPLTQHGIFITEEMDGLNKARYANDRITTGNRTDRFDYF